MPDESTQQEIAAALDAADNIDIGTTHTPPTPGEAAPVAGPPPITLFSTLEPKSIDKATRTLECVISTVFEDRDGDTFDLNGFDFSAYLRNPVLLWAHDLMRPPVGKVVSIGLSPETGQVLAKMQFADTTFAREVFELYADGYLAGFSMGFRPLETEPKPGGKGKHFLRVEVVEVSAVPVPANADALVKSVKVARLNMPQQLEYDGQTATGPDGRAYDCRSGMFNKSLREHGIPVPQGFVAQCEPMDIELVNGKAVVTQARLIGFVQKSGRVLSRKNTTELESLLEELEALKNRINTILEAATPKAKQPDTAGEKPKGKTARRYVPRATASARAAAALQKLAKCKPLTTKK